MLLLLPEMHLFFASATAVASLRLLQLSAAAAANNAIGNAFFLYQHKIDPSRHILLQQTSKKKENIINTRPLITKTSAQSAQPANAATSALASRGTRNEHIEPFLAFYETFFGCF